MPDQPHIDLVFRVDHPEHDHPVLELEEVEDADHQSVRVGTWLATPDGRFRILRLTSADLAPGGQP